MLRGPTATIEPAQLSVQENTHGYDSNIRIMTGIDDLEASDFFAMNSRETRGQGKKTMKQPSRLNLRKFNFSYRVVDDGNSLPNKVYSDSDTLYLAHWPFKMNTYTSIHK